ncbi:two-component system response regulator [Vibrio panuliri]|uniref:Two-component system response regulator n=1 Tax=Vibrio panuliri TaxID=1381081 RepID=A0A1Q9HN28_9VIBR|nr:sigma-54 dependent transcriptional regulator [Vibrio panuliri]OLQ92128.1 two-component system response regulator [Vibrio panuliri]
MNKSNFSVLIVDDDRDVLDAYAHLMSISGLSSKCIEDPTLALAHLRADWAGVVLLDMYMPQMHGLELLSKIKQIDAGIPVIVITGHGDIPMAVDAVKQGACEFVEKPISPPALLTQVKQYLDLRRAYIEQKQNINQQINNCLIGNSAQIEQIRQHIAQFAMLNSHVVVWGEQGSGRHSAAQLIHDMKSPAPELFELQVELGEELEQAVVRLEQGFNGTLVISGLEHGSDSAQRQLVQQLLLAEREQSRAVSVISLFDSDPEAYVARQQIIPELYYLINQGCIKVPALRQRPDDIALLFHYFLKRSCRKLGKNLPKVDSSYLAILRAHTWPGNIRELRNVAELYAIGIVKLTGKERMYSHEAMSSPLDETVEDFEKQLIEDALYLHAGKVSEAASYLQVPRKKLYLRMKKHGLEKEDFKSR